MSKYRNTVYYDFKSRFLAIFSSNYRHRLVLKIPFSDHIFSKISKYRTEKFHFPSTGKYTPPPRPHTQTRLHKCHHITTKRRQYQLRKPALEIIIYIYCIFLFKRNWLYVNLLHHSQ